MTNPGPQVALAALRELPIGQVLGSDHLERLARIACVEDYVVGTTLFAAGDAAATLWMLLFGRVCLSLQAPGREPTELAALSRGDILGLAALHGRRPRSAGARVTKPSRALKFVGVELRELCESDHELGYYMMRHAFEIAVQALGDCRVQLLDVYGRPC